MDIRGTFGLLFTLSLAVFPFSEATARTFTSERVSGVEYVTSDDHVANVWFHFKNGLETFMEHLKEPYSKEMFLQTDATEMLTIFHDSKRVYFTLMEPSSLNGSTGYVAMDTSREWHTVMLTFKEKEARLEVDGVSYYSYMIKAPKLNKKITIGENFTGCLDNFTLNGEDIQASGIFNDLTEDCSYPPYLASYRGSNSFFNMSVPTETKISFLQLTFGFRTFALPTELAVFDLGSGETIKVLLVNRRSIEVRFGTQNETLENTEVTDLNDGSYHSLLMVITLGVRFDVKIDMKHMYHFTSAVSNTLAQTGFVGINLGSNTQNGDGIEGCMRNVLLQLGPASNNTKDFYLSDFSKNNAVIEQCSFKDLCIHEPCAHDTPCTQTKTKDTYSCVCGNSDYEGSDCLTPRITTEVCEQSPRPSADTKIDPDGTGPTPSFQVICAREGDTTWTEIPTEPDGNVNIAETDYPYRKKIEYQNEVTLQQLESLISRSSECKQMISFTCKDSRLMQKIPGTDKPYGYWEGGSHFEPHFYWGGSNSSFPYKCDGGNPCKCDDSNTRPATDDGNLTTILDLPVAAVNFNETSDDATDTSATYVVGSLMCRLDRYLDDSSSVTFSGTTSLAVASVSGDTPVDISFMFRTTVAEGYLIHSDVINDGDRDLYFSVKMSGTEELSITIQSREVNVKSFPVKVNSKLDRAEWQPFYFEMNHNQAFVKVGLTSTSVYIWKTDEFLPNPKLYPTDKIFVGGSPNGSMGFIGCIKNLRIRGRYFNVSDYATDGILNGCVSPCHSNPCLNGGICTDIGSTFVCDCANTGYTGCYCGKDSSSNVTENEKKEYKSDAPPHSGKILQVGFSAEKNDNKFVVVSEDGVNTKLEFSISDTGRLSAKHTADNNTTEQTFDDRVDDGMPHYIRVYQDETKATVGIDDKNMTFEKLFPLSSAHTIEIGTTDQNLQDNKTFKGCVFSIESANQQFHGENTGMDSCAPVDIPMQLKARMVGIMKHIQDSKQKSEARSPPYVESFSAYRLNNELLEGMDSSPVALSQPIKLVCNASGSPKPRIIWKKDNIVQKTDCYHLMTNDSLVLLPLGRDEPLDWTYSCEAESVNLVTRSLNTIHVVNPVSDNSPAVLVQKTLDIGDSATFPCNLGTITKPPAVAVWEKQTTVRGVQSKQVIWEGSHAIGHRIRVTSSGTLVFGYVLPEDSLASGKTTFVCFRRNPATGELKLATRVELSVNGTDLPPNQPEIIFSTQSPVNAVEGDYISLESIGRDYDMSRTPTITWYHDGKELETSSLLGQTNQLNDITEDQAGIYTCKLGDFDERNITVNVRSILKFVIMPGRLTKVIGEEAHFKCIPNRENYTVQWLSNLNPLPASGRYVLTDSNTTLIFRNVSKDADIQPIMCIATAGDSSITAMGSLNVVEPLRVTEPPKDQVLGNDVVQFCVQVKTDPLLSAECTWLKDNKTLDNLKPQNDNFKEIVSIMGKTCLGLDPSKMTSSDRDLFIGQYTCQVSDGVSRKSASAYLSPGVVRDDRLSTAATFGIVFGSIIGITLIVAVVAYFCYYKNKSNRKYGIEGTAGAYKNPAYAN